MEQEQEARCALRARQTQFVDIFRTTPVQTVCPNFYVLAHANGCSFEPQCSYCYLKSSFWYLDQAQAFTNVGDLVEEAKAWIALDDLESYVLNTGNLSDSLGFEKARPLIAQLVELFRAEAEEKGRPHALLLVTKGGMRSCSALFETEPCANIIVSFSVNAPEAARKHESGAAKVSDRLEAARRLKSQGWRVRMRIDPIILGFDYSWIINQLKELAPERVTLGTLRSEANLWRFVNNGLFAALEKPSDPKGMARYPFDQRLGLYRPAVEALSGVCPLGLCEETPDMWEALGLDKDAKSCNCGA